MKKGCDHVAKRSSIPADGGGGAGINKLNEKPGSLGQLLEKKKEMRGKGKQKERAQGGRGGRGTAAGREVGLPKDVVSAKPVKGRKSIGRGAEIYWS